jgi:hypothetical protein
VIAANDLTWRKDRDGWLLTAKGRKFGRVVPDSKYPCMWRPVLSGGRLGDMANLSWCKSVTLDTAVRGLEWKVRECRAQAPSKCPENEGVFLSSSPPIAPIGEAVPEAPIQARSPAGPRRASIPMSNNLG